MSLAAVIRQLLCSHLSCSEVFVFLLSPGYPAPRRCHSCVQIRNGEHFSFRIQQHYQVQIFYSASVADVFICGGYNGEVILADLWKINLQTFQWSKLPAEMPEPAYFHCAAVTPVSRARTETRAVASMTSRLANGTVISALVAFPGRLHVHPRRRGEHSREQENWFAV